MTRRQLMWGAFAALVAAACGGQVIYVNPSGNPLTESGKPVNVITFTGGTGSSGGGSSGGGGGTGTFDYYISTTGDDITGDGSFAHPWSITALGTLPNRAGGATAGNQWAKYGGKRVCLLPGRYTQGQANGAVTTLATLATSTFGFGTGQALFLNGGTAGSPTYIASCNPQGVYLARTAIIDFSSGTNMPAQMPTGGIGQSVNGTGGFHYPPNWGNWTLDGLVIEYYGLYGVIAYYNGSTPLANVTVQNCEIRYGAGLSNNNPGAIGAFENTNLIIQNNKIHDNASVSNFFSGSNSAGSVSGTTLTLTGTSGSFQGGIDAAPSAGLAIYLSSAPGTVAAAHIVSGSGATWTLDTNLGTVASQIIYWGRQSAAPGWQYGWITFQSTGTQVLNNTGYNISLVATKDHTQSVTVAYNYFEAGTWGTPGNPPNTVSPGTPGTAGNIVTGSGMTQYWHHNIFVPNGGLTVHGAFDFFGQDGTINQGSVIFDHNTVYWPSTITASPSLARLEQSTSPGTTGTNQFTNNLVWSDGGAIPAGYGWMVDAGGYTGISSNHNAYIAGITWGTAFGVSQYTLSQWVTATGNDANTISLTSTPFAQTPVSQVIGNFAVAGAAATGSSTAGPIGAMDGSGSVGNNFPVIYLPAATVGTAYTYNLGGTDALAITVAYPNWNQWLTGGNPIPPAGYALSSNTISGTPSQPETEYIDVTDTVTGQPQTYIIVVNPA